MIWVWEARPAAIIPNKAHAAKESPRGAPPTAFVERGTDFCADVRLDLFRIMIQLEYIENESGLITL